MIQAEGTFTSKTAGGNTTYPTFMNNPQYKLRILPPAALSAGPSQRVPARPTEKAHVRAVVEGPRSVPMHVAIVWSGGERVERFVGLRCCWLHVRLICFLKGWTPTTSPPTQARTHSGLPRRTPFSQVCHRFKSTSFHAMSLTPSSRRLQCHCVHL